MTGSALLGHPANTPEDTAIIRGFFQLSTSMPASQALSPSATIPVKTPPGARHDSRQAGLIASMAVLMSLVTVITGTRLSLRLFRKDLKWGLDDWAIILGLVGVLAWCSLVLALATVGGAGKHMYDLTYAEFEEFISLNAVGQTVFYVTVGVIKISITLFNRRLTGLTSKKWMIAHNTFLVLLFCYIIAAIFLNIFSCNPPVVGFRLSVLGQSNTKRHCINNNKFVIPLSVLHIAFDFALLSVPLIVLYKMQMSLSRKLRLCFLFSVGAISCIGAVMRQIIQTTKQPDLTYQFPDFLQWTIIDIFFATTAASLPVLNALIPKGWLSQRSNTSTSRTPKIWSKTKSAESSSTVQDPESRGIMFHERDAEKGSLKTATGSSASSVGKHPNWDEHYAGMDMPGAAR